MASAASLSVLLFNVSGKKSITGITEDQCTGIRRVIEKTKDEPNLFVFGQDDLEGIKLKTLKSSLSMTTPPGSEPPVAGNKEADILEDRRQGSSALTTSFVGPLSFDPFMYPDRLTARKLKFKGQIILLVSWHAPNSGTKDLKVRAFGSLIKYVANMQMKIKADIVILGGDFNITLLEAVEAEEKDKVLTSEKLNGKFLLGASDPTFRKSKDFVVVWPQDQVKLVDEYPKMLKFDFDTVLDTYQLIKSIDFVTEEGGRERTCTSQLPFDHPRLLYRLSIKSPFSDIELTRDVVDDLMKQMAILNKKVDDLSPDVYSEQE